jgi:hydrogenase maturation protein HypF
LGELVRRLAAGARDGQAAADLAWLFHAGFADFCARQVVAAVAVPGVVGLTGGVFANRLFTSLVRAKLAEYGYTALTHHTVPANDGGLALGQALAGYLRLGGK